MSQQDEWQAHPFNARRQGMQHSPNMVADDASTFVKSLDEGSPRSYPAYIYSPETAIPPPPPGIHSPLVSPSKRDSGYRIALAVLIILVMALGSLEVIQMTAHAPLTTYSSGSVGTNQAGITSARHVTASQKTLPKRILTPGTLKENVTLTCGACNDPVISTLTSITIDTTNHRLIITVTLQNISGAQQIDYFAEFNLQDPFGNTYEGTGELNTDFILGAGQRGIKTEIFSFLPNPGSTYTLIARFGISGITYDPLQLTF